MFPSRGIALYRVYGVIYDAISSDHWVALPLISNVYNMWSLTITCHEIRNFQLAWMFSHHWPCNNLFSHEVFCTIYFEERGHVLCFNRSQ